MLTTFSHPALKIQAVVRQISGLVDSDAQLTLSSRQARSIERRTPRGGEWTSRLILPAPKEGDVLLILLQAIKELCDGSEDFSIPNIEPTDMEWVSHRTYSGRKRSEQQYENLVQKYSY